MSAGQAVTVITQAIDRAVMRASAFRATVTAVDGSLIQVQREGASTAGTENYASCTRFLLAVGDVVLCIPVGGKPVVIDVIRRAAAVTPTFAAQAAAGSTAATTGSAGDDTSGTIILLPSGTGITTGTILRITFAVARPSATFSISLTNASADARAMSLSAVVSVGAKTTAKFDIATASALTTGLDYRLDYHIRQY